MVGLLVVSGFAWAGLRLSLPSRSNYVSQSLRQICTLHLPPLSQLFWLVANSIALRFFILFIGVMSCFYSVWDIIDDTIARKVNSSDASEFAAMMGCCGSRVWGVFWLMVSIMCELA